jgi:hypothetical protein
LTDHSRLIRNIPDWPKPGIQFKDITTLLRDPQGLRWAMDELARPWKDAKVDLVLGTEARGFLFAPSLALELGAGCVLARKPGKPLNMGRIRWSCTRMPCSRGSGCCLPTISLPPAERFPPPPDWSSRCMELWSGIPS